ncbi:MAG TPA: hypothetical protein VGO11_21440 [Chthoniobacteraceae bacterium]|nr:hypothetical protein [Chthoniobacteraceae bacterium]
MKESPDAGVVAPAGCAACRTATAKVQRVSLEAAGTWLSRAADLGGNGRAQAWLFAVPSISLCRALPDCEGLRCEAPIRRGTSVAGVSKDGSWFQPAPASATDVATGTSIVQRHVGAATLWAPAPPASLRAAVARHFVTRVAIDEAHPPRCGEATISALLVANNLISYFKPGPRCVSVVPASPKSGAPLTAATEPSLALLGQWLAADSEEPLNSGDLAAIHLLVTALDAAADAERRVPRSVPAAPPPPRGCLGIFLPAKAPPAAPKPRLAEDPHPPATAELRRRLAAHDLLGRAGELFAGTPAEEPPQAAAVLRRLAASEEGYLALALIAREAAGAAGEGRSGERLAEVGRALLDNDAAGSGLHVSTWLLAELLSTFPHPKPPRAEDAPPVAARGGAKHRGAESELWPILCGPIEAGDQARFPRWIADLLRSAAALAAERRPSSRAEGLLFVRIRNAGEALLGGEMLADPWFHLFFVRTFAALAEENLDGFHLPNCGSVGARELCARLEQILGAYEESDQDSLRLTVRAEAEAAMKLPGFARTFRAAEWRRQEQIEAYQESKADVFDKYLHGGAPPDDEDELPGGEGDSPDDGSPPPWEPPAPELPPAAARPEPEPERDSFVPVKVVSTDNPRRQRRPYKSK